MSKKLYAVKKGREPGIYKTYEECLAQVEGYPGAEFRGFTKEAEAKAYIGISKDTKFTKKYQTEAIAYVDGSFNVANGLYGSGVVMFHHGFEHHFFQSGCDPNLVSMRNIAGEINAVVMAVNYCLDHGIRRLTIYHDYIGLFLWVIGKWKTNNEATMHYKTFMTDARQNLYIHFEKVTAHSGNYYNDLADNLAKQAVGLI